jgi:hypothetical protein
MREMRGHIEVAKHNESFCATWNSSHYELALETFEESACGECGCVRGRPIEPLVLGTQRSGGCRDRADIAHDTGRRDALVDPLKGCGTWLFLHHDPPNVGDVRLAATP